MSHLTDLYDPLIEYPDVAELLRLRVLFGLDAQQNTFTESGALKSGIAMHYEYSSVDDDAEDMRSNMRERYAAIELNQPVKVDSGTQFGRNLTLLKDRLLLNEVECCIFTAFAFADQDAMIVSLLQSYLPTARWPTFKKWWAKFCGLNEIHIEECLGPSGSLINMRLFTVDWDSNLSIELIIGCISGLAAAMFNDNPDFISSLGHHFSELVFEETLQRYQFSHASAETDILVPYLTSALQENLVGSNVLLYGAQGSGKAALARIIAHEAGINLVQINSETELGTSVDLDERMRRLRFSQRLLGRSKNTVITFDFSDDALDCAPHNDGAMTALLENNGLPIIWVAGSIKGVSPEILHRFDVVIQLESPPPEALQRMLKDALIGLEIEDSEIKMLAAQPGLNPQIIHRVQRIRSLEKNSSSFTLPSSMAKLCIKSHLEAVGGRIDRTLGDTMIDLTYDVHSSSTNCNLAQLTENLTKVGGGRICLYGPPGTGKTAFAKHLAHRLGKKLKVAPASAVLSRYIGDAEKSIAKLFAHATTQDAVLFFDEVDSLLIDRAGAKHSWEISQVNELLCQMEQFNGVMIAATNQFDILDPAVMRRFDLKVKFNWLDSDQAEQLLGSAMNSLNINLTGSAVNKVRQLKQLAPGDFALVLRQAKFQPVASCDVFVERLEAESRIKTDRNRSIGFA